VVQAGYEGQNIGDLRITLDKDQMVRNVKGNVFDLDDTFSDQQADIEALLQGYSGCLEEYKDELLDIEQETPETGSYYTGYGVCQQCHPDQTSHWQSTKHAEAFDVLIQRGQDYNPECIPCHTTGFTYSGGFIMPGITSEMEGVQCEMCHGAGGDHANSESVPYGITSQSACLPCHTEERSPQFDYPTDYLTIMH